MAVSRLPCHVVVFIGVVFVLSIVAGCGGGGDDESSGLTGLAQSWAYQLTFVQSDPDLFFASAEWAALLACQYDLLVLDYSVDGNGPPHVPPGSTNGEFSAARVAELRASGGGKMILAYLSIGEAEDYRFYWEPNWLLPAPPATPTWLDPAGTGWPGNYNVRYWDPGWQQIIWNPVAGDARGYLNRILDAGFDGVYLDRVDAFEWWDDNSPPGPAYSTFMVNLVEYLSQNAKAVNPNFKIYVQNGRELASASPPGDRERWLAAIDGIASEDTYYKNDGTAQPDSVEMVNWLLIYRDAGKQVLCIDYLHNPAWTTQISDFRARALSYGFVPTINVLPLNRLPDSALWPHQ